jgi:hypothetical protein
MTEDQIKHMVVADRVVSLLAEDGLTCPISGL